MRVYEARRGLPWSVETTTTIRGRSRNAYLVVPDNEDESPILRGRAVFVDAVNLHVIAFHNEDRFDALDHLTERGERLMDGSIVLAAILERWAVPAHLRLPEGI